jgi:hypothetical protein
VDNYGMQATAKVKSAMFQTEARRSAPFTVARKGVAMKEDWRLARFALQELQLTAMQPRVNLLVIGQDSAIQNILDLVLANMDEPIATWCPGEPLVLPSDARAGTIVLRDVSALALEDQHRLLAWSDQAAGRMRLVSTTRAPLFPQVEAGAFIAALYYRLNTVLCDVLAN